MNIPGILLAFTGENGQFDPGDFQSGTVGDIAAPSSGIISASRNLSEIFSHLEDYFIWLASGAALLAVTIGGIMWITATGDEEKIARARNVIKWSLLGAGLVSTAFLIVGVLVKVLVP